MNMGLAPKVNVPDPLPAPAQAIAPKEVEAPELELEDEGSASEDIFKKRKGKKALRVDKAGAQPLSSSVISGLQIPVS
jgi:hypothetical protein